MAKNLPPIVGDAAGQSSAVLLVRTTVGDVVGYVDEDFETDGGDDWLVVWQTPASSVGQHDPTWVAVSSIVSVSWHDPS